MHFITSQAPGILMSDLKNCINDHTSYYDSKGNSLPSSFSISHKRPHKGATQQQEKDLVIQNVQPRDQSHSASFPMFSPPSTSLTFSSSTQDDRWTRHTVTNIKSATVNTRSAFAVHFLPPATAQAILLSTNHKTTFSKILSKCGFFSETSQRDEVFHVVNEWKT